MNYNDSTYICKIIFNNNRSFNPFPGSRDLNFGPEIIRKLRIFAKMGGPRSIICITMDFNWLQYRYIHFQNVSNDFHSFTHILRSVRPPFRAINDTKTSIFPKLKVKDLDLNRFFLIIMVTQTSLNTNHSNYLFVLFQRLSWPPLGRKGDRKIESCRQRSSY